MLRGPLALAIASSVLAAGLVSSSSSAQTCQPSGGPDIVIYDLVPPANYAAVDGIEAFSVGRVHCNVGAAPLAFSFASNQHPVFGSNLFKLTLSPQGSRFEQIGQSWLLHGFFALSGNVCCNDCQPGDGSVLGVHCSDSNTSGRAGNQSMLGPKWQVNAATGEFPFPAASPPFSGGTARRLQVRVTDLTPSSATVAYFAESQAIAADDAAAGHGANNATYRRATMSGSGDTWTMSYTGTSQREQPGIRAWADTDEGVVESDLLVPGDGWLLVAADATDMGNGSWHYEYAVQNLNSDRSARAFSIPVEGCGNITNVGFHDVDYRDGDGPGNVNFDGTDWSVTIADGAITWATQTFAQNESANALRWGTLYNFRFDSTSPPLSGGAAATITLFKPGEPQSVRTGALPVPSPRASNDPNGDGRIDIHDLTVLLSHYGTPGGATLADGDLDGDGDVDIDDLAGLLAIYGTSCP
jgi:hypothetical protein